MGLQDLQIHLFTDDLHLIVGRVWLGQPGKVDCGGESPGHVQRSLCHTALSMSRWSQQHRMMFSIQDNEYYCPVL